MSIVLKTLFSLLDILLLNISIYLAFIYFETNFWAVNSQEFIYMVVYSNLAWFFLVMVSAPYNLDKSWALVKILKNQLSFLFIHLLVIASLMVFFEKNYSFLLIAFIYLLFVPTFFCYRLMVLYFRKLFSKDVPYRNFIIIGRNFLAVDIRKFYLMNSELGYKFNGYVEFEKGTIPMEKINAICINREIQEIFCCVPLGSEEELSQLINFGLNSLIKVKMVFEPENQSIQLNRFDKHPGIDIAVLKLDDPYSRIIKRIFDLFFAGVISVLFLSWFIPIVGLLIKLDSKGPIFFIQQRKGRRNIQFGCIKFRTMVQNLESAERQASRNDPRITKFGSFLRKSSIDELPQFINVLLGSMSVVGPRPQMPKHYDEYSKIIDEFMGRHYVKSGITGLAQCMGYRGEIRDIKDMENRVRLDRYYIEHWTFWFDIKIIFLTLVSLIRGSDRAF